MKGLELGYIIEKIKKNKKIFLLTIAVVMMVILLWLGRLKVDKKPDADVNESDNIYVIKNESDTNTWNGVTPGLTNLNEIKEDDLFGSYEKRTRFDGKDIYVYKNQNTGIRRNEVSVDNSGKIKYFWIRIPYTQADSYESRKAFLGLTEPDIVKYDKSAADGGYVLSHVFLDEGIMLNVAKRLQLVYSEMYFEPMSEEQFMDFWGERLSDEYYHPQDAGYE